MYRRTGGATRAGKRRRTFRRVVSSCIRLEDFSARRDVYPQQPPITSIVFPWKALSYSFCAKERETPSPISLPTPATITFSRPTLWTSRPFRGRKHCREKDFSLIGAARRALYLHEHLPLCATGRADLKFGASHLAAGLISAPIRTFASSER